MFLGVTHEEEKGASSGCSAKIAEKYLVFSTGHFNKIFIMGILIPSEAPPPPPPPNPPIHPPPAKSQAFYLEVLLLDFSSYCGIITNGNGTEKALATSTQQKGLLLTGQCFGGQTTRGGEDAAAQVLTETRS